MAHDSPKAWVCPVCSRRVPPKVDECRCGASRPLEEAAPLPDGGRDAESEGDARPRASVFVGWLFIACLAAVLITTLVWRRHAPQAPPVSDAASAAPFQPASTPPAAAAPGAPVSPAGEARGSLADFTAALRPVLPSPQSASVEDVAQRVVQAVVLIESDLGRGTGFFTSGGLILTNAHVVGSQGYVKLRQADGQQLTGQVVRSVPAIDLAIVRPERVAAGQMMLPLRPVNAVRVGQEVLAVGSALGVLQNTVTRGIVSAVRSAGGVTLIQTDAAVNPGNSGGPLVDKQGWAIGVTTMKIGGRAESLGFAVAADHAAALLEGRDDVGTRAGGTLEERVQTSMTGDSRSADDRRREEATAELERRVERVAQAAARLDTSWSQYRSSCLSDAVIERGYDREWFALIDTRKPTRSPSPGCATWTTDLVNAAEVVRRAMLEALGDARPAGVFPGDIREICRRHRLEWAGW